ncbi:uncharacterized protein LOC126406962 [Epinephelus moara]|uniref:uncharacterized protein LOC126406962 n=1 Tax=Epinephelus moara TaxID=300413 RepID=UPI00214E1391|nr:uncharacterized protein LOC126406962 [Epinephelus moara]XP_049927535.1 uncharacterized protein LOC126406962 [Epinephelus moara]
MSCCTDGAMSTAAETEQVESGGSAEDQKEDSPKQPKSRPGPEFLSLTRCAACYNEKASSMLRWGDEGESSTSAEDSGPEVDWESSSSSSSSSSEGCSEPALSETLGNPSPVSGDAAEAERGGKDGDGEVTESQEDKNKKMTQRARLVKSSSLPQSPVPHLTPLSLLPRPHTVVSTLQLQVLSQKHDDDGNDDTFLIVKQQLSGREEEEEKTGESKGGRQEGINSVRPPQPFQWQQTGLPWQQWSQPTLQQHQLSYQQQPQHFPPLSAQCQRLPPPSHTLPVPHLPMLHPPRQALNAPHRNLHAPTPQPCWCCHSMHLPHVYHSQ